MNLTEILERTLKVVPTKWDMNHENFNCGCHLQCTPRTYELVMKYYGVTNEDAKSMIDKYLDNEL